MLIRDESLNGCGDSLRVCRAFLIHANRSHEPSPEAIFTGLYFKLPIGMMDSFWQD
jgi:hypothetical protein